MVGTRIVTFFAALLLQSSIVQADRSFHSEIEPYLATKRPYTAPLKTATLPANCTLIHINHLGRHGSRFPGDKSAWVDDFQKPAENLGLLDSQAQFLTPEGKKLVAILSSLIALYNSPESPAGNITEQGAREQQTIAQGMIAASGLDTRSFLEQIQKRSGNAKSTVVHRTQTSRSAFLQSWHTGESSGESSLNISLITPDINELDTELQFYKFCKNMVQTWPQIIEKTNNDIYKPLVSSGVKEKLQTFSSHFLAGLTAKQATVFSKILYKLCALDANQDYSLGVCLLMQSAPEYEAVFETFGQITSNRQFYGRGPAKEQNNINAVVAVDLLNSFLDTTAKAIDNPETPFVELRFAHESTLLRLMQVLGLITYDNATNSKGEVTWPISEWCPMSANLAWQTLQCEDNGEQSIKTRMLVNERVMPFPIAGCDSEDGLCDWLVVEAYYRFLYRGVTLEDVCGEVSVQFSSHENDNK